MAKQVAKRDDNRVPVNLGTGNDSDAETRRLLVDPTSNRLLVDSEAEAVGHGEVGDGTTTVASAGTRVQLSTSSVPCKRVFLQANKGNSGILVVGGVTCVAAEATRRGIALIKHSGIWIYVNNLNLLYIDSTGAGDKAHYYYEN